MKWLQKILMTVTLLTAPLCLAGFTTGFNQAWTHDDYGRQWIERFDGPSWQRILRLTRLAEGKILRVWLFEGHNWEGIQFDERGAITGLDPVKIQNIKTVLAMARQEGVQIYFTLFDGNVPYFMSDDDYHRRSEERYRKLFSNREGFQDQFLENVLKPLLDNIVPEYRNSIYAIDVVNELNATVTKDWFSEGWQGANEFMKRTRMAVRSRTDIPLTASFGHFSAIQDLMSRELDFSTVDFFDVHLYDDRGNIPHCSSLSKFIARSNKSLILGEFGQFNPFFSDTTQSMVVKSRILNSDQCGFSAVLAWRLEEKKDGEKRFSFLNENGEPRPAFWVFRDMTLRKQKAAP